MLCNSLNKVKCSGNVAAAVLFQNCACQGAYAADAKIQDSCADPYFKSHSANRHDLKALKCQIWQGDEGSQRGFLESGNTLSRQRWNSQAQRLRKYDVAKCSRAPKTQRQRRIPLSLWYAFNASSQNFGNIHGLVYAQCHNCSHHASQLSLRSKKYGQGSLKPAWSASESLFQRGYGYEIAN